MFLFDLIDHTGLNNYTGPKELHNEKLPGATDFVILDYYQLIEAETKWPPFSRRHFEKDFLEWKCMNFDLSFIKFVRRGPINHIPAMAQMMAWHRQGDKPLSKPIKVVYWRIYAPLGLNELRHLENYPTTLYFLMRATFVLWRATQIQQSCGLSENKIF